MLSRLSWALHVAQQSLNSLFPQTCLMLSIDTSCPNNVGFWSHPSPTESVSREGAGDSAFWHSLPEILLRRQAWEPLLLLAQDSLFLARCGPRGIVQPPHSAPPPVTALAKFNLPLFPFTRLRPSALWFPPSTLSLHLSYSFFPLLSHLLGKRHLPVTDFSFWVWAPPCLCPLARDVSSPLFRYI